MAIDYYSYAPLVTPDRPLAVVGRAEARADRVARVMSILTGLPLFLLDRAVEHRFGKDLARIVREDGPAARQRAEAILIARPLAQKTPPILALGDMTLVDPTIRRRIVEETTLIHLQIGDTDLDRLFATLAHRWVDMGERSERRVAQQILEDLDLYVELPE